MNFVAVLWPFAGLAIIILLPYLQPARNCPDCGTPLPRFQSSATKTRAQWLRGGYLCSQCGCECDRKGNRLAANSDHRPAPLLGTVLVSTALLGAFLLPVVIFLWRS